jgi:hypothetical protein
MIWNLSARLMQASLVVAPLLLLLGCTTFDDAVVPEPATHPGYLSLLESASLCSLVSRCPLLSESIARSSGVPASGLSFSTCLSWLSGPLPANRYGLAVQSTMLACMAKSTQCSEALACAPIELFKNDDPRCVGMMGARCETLKLVVDCDNHVALRCTPEFTTAGAECRLGNGSAAQCALEGCFPGSAPPYCEAGVYVRCDPTTNLRIATNCAATGLTCANGAEGASALCSTSDGVFPCDTPGLSTCSKDGERARVCDGSFAAEFDCAAMGAQCVETATGARCASAKEACSPQDPGIDTCAGTHLSVCVSGERIQLDCSALGLSCIPSDGTQSGHCG